MRGSDPTALPGPARSLAPRVYHYGVDATVLAAAGLAGAGFAPLTHHSVLAIPALGFGCACAAARMTFGIREKARGQMLDRLAESLHTGLGFIKPSRRSVRARKWTQGWSGVPNVVTLRYAAQVGDDDPMWASAICDIVGRRLLATYRISKHDRRRCVLRLRRVRTPASSASPPHRPVLERAELTITELVGPTASIRDDRWSTDGELVGFTVHHAAGTKLAASGYRRRVETVVSTMLPGRWRAKWDLEADEARFEVRPTFPTNIWIPTTSVDGQDDDILSSYDSVEIPYAVDEDRHVQVWRPAHDPNLMLVGAPGTGKALSLDTPVATATGWTTMGEIQAGDVVFDETGRHCRVLTAHPVRRDRPCYEVTFSDGSVVVADEEHLWWTSTRAERSSRQRHGRRWATPRVHRLTAAQSEALLLGLQRAAADVEWTLTIPAAARLIGIRESHEILRRISNVLPPAQTVQVGPRERPARAYPVVDLLHALSQWGNAPHRSDKTRSPAGAVRTTAELHQTVATPSGHLNHSIPVAGALAGGEVHLPFAPYALGAWLGDGDHWHPIITSADPEIVHHLADAGVTVRDVNLPPSTPAGYRARRYHLEGGHAALDALGLLRQADPVRRRRHKHIPAVYLRASIAQRRALLAGLMDTDGTVSRKGACEFTSTSRQLAADTHELACTLGFRATITPGTARLNGRDCGPLWTVAWTCDVDVFHLERKRIAHKQRTANYSPARNECRYITSVRPVPSVPVRCITVDSPSHLYLAGRTLIPTHNTVAAHTILVTASRRGWPIWVVDGKSIEFLGFQGWPNVQIVATNIEEQVAVIHRAWEVMEHRYNLIVTGRAREADFEPLLVFLDEFADFRSNLMAWYTEIKVKGDPTKPVVLSRAASISRKGRTSRVHLVFGTQRPDAEYFGGDMRDNFRMRVSMGRLSPQGAMMVFESPVVGTSIPRGCRGRATAIDDDNRPIEVQTFQTPDPRKAVPGGAEAALLDRLRPPQGRHERLLILTPKTQLDLDTSDAVQPTYSEYASATWVRATDHPELDSVLQRQTYVSGGRDVASPMSIFGLSSATPTRTGSPSSAVSNQRSRVEEGSADVPSTRSWSEETAEEDELEISDGYGTVGTRRPAAVQIGDLILVDEDTGQWATVDENPGEDYAEPGCIALSWRDDDDNRGSLTVPEDTLLSIRRPLDEEPA